jgi:dolichol-phosphate mannosyltransferase
MISIIIPLFNEAENVLQYPKNFFPIAEEIADRFKETCEYVLVDDGSHDSTLRNLKELQTTHENIIVVSHNENKGMGAAIKSGIAQCKGELIITMDSDLSYRPEDIENLMIKFRETGADCISASPYREKDLTTEFSHPLRIFLSKSINFFYRLLLREDITCVSAIFRLYKRGALTDLKIESDNFEIDAEILAKLILNKKSVCEISVKLHNREFGESKLNVRREIKNNLKILYKIFKTRVFKHEWK